jgi:hypothetical protein
MLGNIYDVYEIKEQLISNEEITNPPPPYQITQVLLSLKEKGYVIQIEAGRDGRDCWALAFSEPDEPEVV